jgi:chromate transporter
MYCGSALWMDKVIDKRDSGHSSVVEIFLIFLRLGLTSFGGPIAHLGYFRAEFVARRKWLDERAYAELVALCQFLPGPASSEVGMALGLSRGGIAGAFAAWLGFTLPSAVLLTLFALGYGQLTHLMGSAWLHGLMIAAVAVVAQAILSMARLFCRDLPRAGIALLAAAVAMLFPTSWAEIAAIAGGGLLGLLLLKPGAELPDEPVAVGIGRRSGAFMLAAFAALLMGLPLLAAVSGAYPVQLFDRLYRTGALVFGGGHVVLPLLQAAVVPKGWVPVDSFLAGYGAAQAVPGPLFSFAAYIGARSSGSPAGWVGAGIALVAIFLPAFLLICGLLPFWGTLRRNAALQRAMPGVNAAVVGILLVAFYRPVWTTAIVGPVDLALGVGAFALLVWAKSPPWLVVVLCALVTGLRAAIA